MHFMSFDRLTLYRFECPGTHMQRKLFAAETFGFQLCQYFRSEMESGCRSGNRTFYLGINRLISLQVAFFRFSVQVGRNRQFTRGIQYFGEAESTIPAKPDLMCLPVTLHLFCTKRYLLSVDLYLPEKARFFPFLRIPDQADPATGCRFLEDQFVIVRLGRIETKYFYLCPRRTLE